MAERYWHTFSAAHPVLLTVKPGDHIVTKTVDSAGFDLTGVRRTATHGNPLTGPFFVEDAEPGDALEVRIDRIRLNRTTGYSGYQVQLKKTPRVEKPGADLVYKGYDHLLPWTIDLKRVWCGPEGWSSWQSQCWGASVLRRNRITRRDRGRRDTGVATSITI